MSDPCTQCGENPRAGKHAWCNPCQSAARKARRVSNGDVQSDVQPVSNVQRVQRPVVRGTAVALACGACAHRKQAVKAAFDLFVQGADKGLLARLAWVGFYDRVMEALD